MAGDRWELLEHQQHAVDFCTARQNVRTDQYPYGKGALMMVPPGGGKTYIMAELLRAVPMATAVVAPAHLVDQLVSDFRQLLPGDLDVLTGSLKKSQLPLTKTTVLVCSWSDVKKDSFADMCARRIIVDEVDTLSNGAHCYPQLLDPNVRQGAACWGFTGTVIRNSWQDARRSLAFVTGDTAWEQASEEAVKAEAGKRNDWYYIGPPPPELPHKLEFTLRPIMFTQPEEWVLLGSCSSYKQLQKLGTSGATAAAEAEAAAAAAASAAAPTVGSKRWMPKNLPGHLRGVFDIGTNDDDSSSASTNPISSWLQAKLLPSMPGLVAVAQADAANMTYEEAISNVSSVFVPTLLFMVVTCVNIEHPDEPVVVLCDTKEQVQQLQHEFEQCTVDDKYMEYGRPVFALVGSAYGSLKATLPKQRAAFLQGFYDSIASTKGGLKAPPVLVAIKECLTVGVNDLQKHVSVMHLLSPSFDPSRDYQAISRVHRRGQVADKVRVVSWVQLGMHENRYLHQVLKTRDYPLFQEDVRLLLGLPVLIDTPGMAGAADDTDTMPADAAATSEPLAKRLCTGLQGGTDVLRADVDSDQSYEDSEDGFYDMP